MAESRRSSAAAPTGWHATFTSAAKSSFPCSIQPLAARLRDEILGKLPQRQRQGQTAAARRRLRARPVHRRALRRPATPHVPRSANGLNHPCKRPSPSRPPASVVATALHGLARRPAFTFSGTAIRSKSSASLRSDRRNLRPRERLAVPRNNRPSDPAPTASGPKPSPLSQSEVK